LALGTFLESSAGLSFGQNRIPEFQVKMNASGGVQLANIGEDLNQRTDMNGTEVETESQVVDVRDLAFENLVLSDRAPQVRKKELLEKRKEINRLFQIYVACFGHRTIIRQSIQRNLELIVLYLDFCTQAGSDKRLQRTCELYQRLSRELEEANKKLMELDESLAAKSSMDRASYEMESQKINLELERLRFSEGDEDEGDSDDKDDPGE
jgi:hypothetical protein